MSVSFYMPPLSLMGQGALKGLGSALNRRQLKKALVVADSGLVKLGLIEQLTAELDRHGVHFVLF